MCRNTSESDESALLLSLAIREDHIERHFDRLVAALKEHKERFGTLRLLYAPTLKRSAEPFLSLVRACRVTYALMLPIPRRDAIHSPFYGEEMTARASWVGDCAYFSWVHYENYMKLPSNEEFQLYAAYKEMSRIDAKMLIASETDDFASDRLTTDLIRMRRREHTQKPFELLMLDR